MTSGEISNALRDFVFVLLKFAFATVIEENPSKLPILRGNCEKSVDVQIWEDPCTIDFTAGLSHEQQVLQRHIGKVILCYIVSKNKNSRIILI